MYVINTSYLPIISYLKCYMHIWWFYYIVVIMLHSYTQQRLWLTRTQLIWPNITYVLARWKRRWSSLIVSKKAVSTEPKFWHQNSPDRFKPRVGELEPDVSSLSQTLRQADKLGLLHERDDDEFRYSGIVSFDLPDETCDRKSDILWASVEVRYKPATAC